MFLREAGLNVAMHPSSVVGCAISGSRSIASAPSSCVFQRQKTPANSVQSAKDELPMGTKVDLCDLLLLKVCFGKRVPRRWLLICGGQLT